MLTPASGDEATVAQLVMFVHDTACRHVPGIAPANEHDPLCNTMRLLAEDHAHLMSQNTRRWRLRGVPPEQGART
jgi:hypothetical protein